MADLCHPEHELVKVEMSLEEIRAELKRKREEENADILFENRPATPQETAVGPELTDWGDEVTTHSSGAKRANGGKIRYDLMPIVALRDTAQIWSFGAEKYTEAVDRTANSALSWLQEELKTCLIATSVLPNRIARTCVEAATNEISVKTILSTLRDSAQTQESGERKIQIALKHFRTNGSKIPNAGSETLGQRSSMHSSGLDSQKIPLHFYYKSKEIPVQFVNETFLSARVISIIAMRQGKQEAIFVVGATTDSECLETILKASKQHFDTSTSHQLQASSFSPGNPVTHTISGEGNWIQGFDWSGPYASMQRHLQAWFAGEDFDPESGLSHLAHAACNLQMLQQFEYSYRQGDNRPAGSCPPMRTQHGEEQEDPTPGYCDQAEKPAERGPARW